MLQAGLIQKVGSGIYTWLPLGSRLLHKISAIVRKEMNLTGAQEMIMPFTQPAALWQKSGRWLAYGPELLRLQDRHQNDFCLGPTHEEVVVETAKQLLESYKQLPLNLYQIQNKFRDEVRPRYGLLRGREFVMKDAYSFHMSQESLDDTYTSMHHAYCRILESLGLDYKAVVADTGSIGGSSSHEFHVLADVGEDTIAIASNSGLASNIETIACETLAPLETTEKPKELVATYEHKTIDSVCEFLELDVGLSIKSLIFHAKDHTPESPKLIMAILRGDHTLNKIKLEKTGLVATPLQMASEAEVASLGLEFGAIGPINSPIPLLLDATAAAMRNFCCGANQSGMHFVNANWSLVDAELILLRCDIRNIEEGEKLEGSSEDKVILKKGIEVGHIFKLGSKYSKSMALEIVDTAGRRQNPLMGCYGIGVSRIAAACIEQLDTDGTFSWPMSIAPIEVVIVPLQYHKNQAVKELADSYYQELLEQGTDVVLDERGLQIGAMLSDWELVGVPLCILVSPKAIDNGLIEIRGQNHTLKVGLQEVVAETLKAKQEALQALNPQTPVYQAQDLI